MQQIRSCFDHGACRLAVTPLLDLDSPWLGCVRVYPHLDKGSTVGPAEMTARIDQKQWIIR